MKELKIIKRLEKLAAKVKLLRDAETRKKKNRRYDELWDAQWHIVRAEQAMARAASEKEVRKYVGY